MWTDLHLVGVSGVVQQAARIARALCGTDRMTVNDFKSRHLHSCSGEPASQQLNGVCMSGHKHPQGSNYVFATLFCRVVTQWILLMRIIES